MIVQAAQCHSLRPYCQESNNIKKLKEVVLPMIESISKISFMSLYLILIQSVVTGQNFPELTALATLLILITNLPKIKGSFRVPTYVFCAASVVLFIVTGMELSVFIAGLNAMSKTIAIIGIMQTLTVSIELGNYSEAVTSLIGRYAKREGILFAFILLMSHLLASILNLGSIFIVHSAFGEELQKQIKNFPRFLAKAASRGFTTSFLWAPGSVTVLIVIQTFQLTWKEYLFPALTIAISGMLLSLLIEVPHLSRDKLSHPVAHGMTDAEIKRKTIQMAVAILCVCAGILLLEFLGLADASGRLLLTAFIVSAVWLLSQWRSPGFSNAVHNYWDKKIQNNSDLSVFFISIGLFSTAIGRIGLYEMLQALATRYEAFLGHYILLVLPLGILAFSMIGLHPMISMLLIGPVVTGLQTAASPLQLGMAMALGCSLSYSISPFAGMILTLSKLLDVPPQQVSIKWNGLYALLFYILASFLIQWLF